MDQEHDALVLAEKDERGVLTIALNRPDKRNALNIPMLELLAAHLSRAQTDAAIRVIVLRGAGPVFCAGLDLKEAQDPELAKRSAHGVANALEAIYTAPQPTIAAVHGASVAGGAGLMSACDIAYAADGTKLGYPEVRRGLVAGLVMTFLRRQLPERQARALLLTGSLIDAETAAAIGLVNRSVPTDDLDATVELCVSEILKGAPEAIAITKRHFDRLYHHTVREDLFAALNLHVEVRNTASAQEGMRAFTEKRDPKWTA